jgi:amidase
MAWALGSATEMAAALRARQISAVELLDLHFSRIDRFNPSLNAIVVQDREGARRSAVAADETLARGEIRGPLHGVPITVKEAFDVAGLPTTWGDPGLRSNIAARTAPSVRSLLDAGAVLIGKTNVPYLLSDWQTFNAIHGITRNPWDLGTTPGGSSGGAAVALAAGMSALELGSDIGSSIRNPAHYCGVFGHKPSFGIVPQAGHGIPVARAPLDVLVCGPLARSAEDLALAMDLLISPEPQDAPGWQIRLPRPSQARLSDYRVGVLLNSSVCAVDDAVTTCLESAITAIGSAGARVDRTAQIDWDLTAFHETYLRVLRGASGALLPVADYQALEQEVVALGPEDGSYRARMARAATQSHRAWFQASEERHRIREAFARLFETVDVLLCPVAASAAFPHDQDRPRWARTITINGQQENYNDQLFWAGIASLPNLPATVVPAGRTPGGLPVGLQIIGPYLQDHRTIAFGRHVSDVIGGFASPPGYA